MIVVENNNVIKAHSFEGGMVPGNQWKRRPRKERTLRR
jgi:hypothetical protein